MPCFALCRTQNLGHDLPSERKPVLSGQDFWSLLNSIGLCELDMLRPTFLAVSPTLNTSKCTRGREKLRSVLRRQLPETINLEYRGYSWSG